MNDQCCRRSDFKISALTPRDRYVWGLNFFKLFFEYLVGIKPENRKRASCSRTKCDFLRAIRSFLYQNQVSSFFLPGTALVGYQEDSSSSTPVLHFWGLGLCVAHQDIAGRDALHESTSGGCAGDSENVLVWVCFSCCPPIAQLLPLLRSLVPHFYSSWKTGFFFFCNAREAMSS